ncbi:hypothetical protein FisN_14Lh283 [Fistulifera solaris]|uniref:DoxX family protein n=1 Tax=Fistulifera solaris TaxID=1519565 RepID=A0A1Z5J9T7_FISSO|nr:hypothetical protein FisN_14Lh283 [Fistulifera solaris]|eukprot:GAX10763.1 hypothetical protein FisN_14Lh283 [Fistulifera solaris]
MKILSNQSLLPNLLTVVWLITGQTQAFTPQWQRPRSTTTIIHRMAPKEETTWDRITGPKLFKTVTNWQGIHAFPLVPLRILTGLLMIHHGSEGGTLPANVGTAEFQGFVDFVVRPYFGFLPGPVEIWAALHDYIEFGGGILLALGCLTRPAALSLLITMMGAVYFHLSATGAQGFPLGHVPNFSYDFEEPTLYALIFLLFWFNGAGPLSIDSIVYQQISQEENVSEK